jgi:hypothetical protein
MFHASRPATELSLREMIAGIPFFSVVKIKAPPEFGSPDNIGALRGTGADVGLISHLGRTDPHVRVAGMRLLPWMNTRYQTYKKMNNCEPSHSEQCDEAYGRKNQAAGLGRCCCREGVCWPPSPQREGPILEWSSKNRSGVIPVLHNSKTGVR